MKNPPFNQLAAAVAELRAINLPGWGGNYVPAILAKKARGEGPSRVSRNECSWLRRSLHMLSKAEQGVARLALYHPALFELREQVPFSCGPASHPMAGHPQWIGKEWPCTAGTIKIANAFGELAHHPRTWVEGEAAPDDAAGGRWEPQEWVGDILLFLLDRDGPYCVHWDVKALRGEHGRPSTTSRK